MSPKTKKILMIAGAAVAGYVVYTRVIKKPAVAAPVAPTLSAADRLKTAAISAATQKIASINGVEEELGSLGGSCF
jgi:hypothetical protein